VLAGRALVVTRLGLAIPATFLGAGIVAVALGLVLDAVLMPINKNLWTPAYCVFMTGCSLITFAAFHAAMDATAGPLRTATRKAFLPLTIYGMNALFIFAFSGLVARLLVPFKASLYAPIRSLPLTPENASLVYAVAFELAMFAVAWILWRKRWFVKV